MDLSFSLMIGFLSSMHCVGMCGGLVAGYAVQRGGGQLLSGVSSHLFYNGGRVLAYTFLGGGAGLIGKGIGSLQMAGPWFSMAIGALMILFGLVQLGAVPLWPSRRPGAESRLRTLHLQTIASLVTERSREGAFYVGLLTPLLPCGILYAMVLKAAETGGVASGALTMLAFGLGTIPALFVTGLLTTYLNIWFRLYATRVAAIMILVMGILLLYRGVHKM